MAETDVAGPSGGTPHVVVVGGGPAGIAAATRAAEAGRRVLLVDEGMRPGGQIWRHRSGIAPEAAAVGGSGGEARPPRRAREWLARLEASGARALCEASVVDAPGPLELLVEIDGRPVRIVASDAVVLATGARELLLPFPGWTLPGVFGVGGAQAMLKAGMSVRGKNTVVAGSGPLLLAVAASLARAGARMRVVAEQAPAARVGRFALGLWRSPGRLLDAARYRAGFARSRYRTGTWVRRARGDGAVASIELTDGRRTHTLPCELLCVGYGLVGQAELARLLECAVGPDGVEVDRLQRTTVEGVFCAGEPTAIGGLDAALIEGEIAGLAAAGRLADAEELGRRRDRELRFARAFRAAFALRPEVRELAEPSTVVCRCEDVPLEHVAGYASAREAKLHARVGMGPCQGRVCGAALGVIHGWPPDSVRPPIAPAGVATLAAGGRPPHDGDPPGHLAPIRDTIPPKTRAGDG